MEVMAIETTTEEVVVDEVEEEVQLQKTVAQMAISHPHITIEYVE
jgi:hypothetical protein